MGDQIGAIGPTDSDGKLHVFPEAQSVLQLNKVDGAFFGEQRHYDPTKNIFDHHGPFRRLHLEAQEK